MSHSQGDLFFFSYSHSFGKSLILVTTFIFCIDWLADNCVAPLVFLKNLPDALLNFSAKNHSKMRKVIWECALMTND